MLDYEIQDNDIVIRNGDTPFIDGAQATRQRLEQKLRLWRGEWYFNLGSGFPWLQEVLGQRPRPEVIRSLIQQIIEGDPGVRALLSLNIETFAERGLRIEFQARLIDGEIEQVELEL